MSLTINGASSPYVYAKDDPSAQGNSANQAKSASSGATASHSQYLGGYIKSASAALSLLTQTSEALSQNEQRVTSDKNSTTIQSDGVDFFQAAAGLGNNVYAQAYASTIKFNTAGSQATVSGEFNSSIATAGSSTSPTSADGSSDGAQISAKITQSNAAGTSISIQVGDDPKAVDQVYVGNGGGPLGAIGDAGKQFIQNSIEGFFEYEGLSKEAATKEASAVANFVWQATDPISRNELPASGGASLPAVASAAAAATSSPTVSSSSAANSSSSSSSSTTGATTSKVAAV